MGRLATGGQKKTSLFPVEGKGLFGWCALLVGYKQISSLHTRHIYFENEFRKHVLVARNSDSNLISKFILQGVHQDILLKLLNRSATPIGRKKAETI